MGDTSPLSPISQVLASMGLTRADLVKHADQMRDFLSSTKDEENKSEIPSNAPPLPIPRQSSPSPASSGSKTEPTLDPITPAKRSESMEEVLERKRVQTRRDRRSKRGKEREEKDKTNPSEQETDTDAFTKPTRRETRANDVTPLPRTRYMRSSASQDVAPAPSSPLPASSPFPAATSSPLSSPAKAGYQVPVSSPGPYSSPWKDKYGPKPLPFTLPPGPYSTQKPSYSYAAIIGRAVLASPNHALTLQDIYTYMVTVFPFFDRSELTWQNSVRHVLSTTAVFRKTPRARKEGRTLWAIWDEDLSCFEDGGFKKERCADMVAELNNRKPGIKRAATFQSGSSPGDHASKRPRTIFNTSGHDDGNRQMTSVFSLGGTHRPTNLASYLDSRASSQPDFRLKYGGSTTSLESSSTRRFGTLSSSTLPRLASSASSTTSEGRSTTRFTLSSASFPSTSSQAPDDDYESDEDQDFDELEDDDDYVPLPPSSRDTDVEAYFAPPNRTRTSSPSTGRRVPLSRDRIPPVPDLDPNEDGDSSSSPPIGSDDEAKQPAATPSIKDTATTPEDSVDVKDEMDSEPMDTTSQDGDKSDIKEEAEMDPETEARLFDDIFQTDRLGTGFSPSPIGSPRRRRSAVGPSNDNLPRTPSRSSSRINLTSPSRAPISYRGLHMAPSSPGLSQFQYKAHSSQSGHAPSGIFPNPRTPGTPRRLLFGPNGISSSQHVSPYRDTFGAPESSLLDELSRESPGMNVGLFERVGLLYDSPGAPKDWGKRRDSRW